MDKGRRIAYLIFRLTLGVNIFVHGVGRITGGGADAFAAQTAREFANTPLPPVLVHLFLVSLPAIEALIGTLILLGWFTLWALAAGGLLIAALVFGTAMRGDWNTVGVQMIYAIVYYLLLAHHADNAYSIDGLLRRT